MSKYESKILEAMHETAKGFHKAGVMTDQTMREFDARCLSPVPEYTPIEIKEIRLKNHASQSVFAAYLNISPSTVQKWEQGQKKPNSTALKILSLVKKKGLQILAA